MLIDDKSRCWFPIRFGTAGRFLVSWFAISWFAWILWIVVPPACAQASSSDQYHQQFEALIQGQAPNREPYNRQSYFQNHHPFNRLAIEAGAGFTVPTGDDATTWQNTGYNVKLGAGFMFGQYLGMLAEYSFNGANIPNSTLAAVDEPGGNVHIWSLTLDPVLYLSPRRRFDPYVTGGGGFYRKLTTFTQPVYVGDYCDYFYGCFPQFTNVTLSHFSSNQGGINIGGGLAFSLSESGNAKFYAEAQYVWVDSPDSTTNSVGTGPVRMVPVTFGFRW